MFISVDVAKNKIRSYVTVHMADVAVDKNKLFPKKISLGKIMTADYVSNPSFVLSEIDKWREFDSEAFTVIWAKRNFYSISMEVPVNVVISDCDAAILLCTESEQALISRMCERVECLRRRYVVSDEVLHRYAKRLGNFTSSDFLMLLEACDWFLCNDPHDMTPRQIPIAGLHAKWLDNKSVLISDIVGRKLDLKQRMKRIRFSYCDPTYLDSGKRRFDTHVIGDVCELNYEPKQILIIENKDCFECLSDVEGLICVFGEGYSAVALLDRVPFVKDCDNIFYWGDIDADGFSALALARSKLGDVKSILMNRKTYDKYLAYGTPVDKNGVSLALRSDVVIDSSLLTDEETDMLNYLQDKSCRIKRIEQERMLFSDVRDALAAS